MQSLIHRLEEQKYKVRQDAADQRCLVREHDAAIQAAAEQQASRDAIHCAELEQLQAKLKDTRAGILE